MLIKKLDNGLKFAKINIPINSLTNSLKNINSPKENSLKNINAIKNLNLPKDINSPKNINSSKDIINTIKGKNSLTNSNTLTNSLTNYNSKELKYSITTSLFIKPGSSSETTINNGITHFSEHIIISNLPYSLKSKLINGYTTKEFMSLHFVSEKPIHHKLFEFIKKFQGKINSKYNNLKLKNFKTEKKRVLDEFKNQNQINSKYSNLKLKNFKTEKKRVLDEFKNQDLKNDEFEIFLNNHHRLMNNKKLIDNDGYKFPIIGNKSNIINLKQITILDFLKNYFKPKNMAIVTIGDFKSQLKKVKKEKVVERGINDNENINKNIYNNENNKKNENINKNINKNKNYNSKFGKNQKYKIIREIIVPIPFLNKKIISKGINTMITYLTTGYNHLFPLIFLQNEQFNDDISLTYLPYQKFGLFSLYGQFENLKKFILKMKNCFSHLQISDVLGPFILFNDFD
ncbi:hypothetical protein DMUE_0068 [Dictyocoela muelleri]|nr:hypothetical protein DMUE_0068 [Dictyocoela muelleri]